MKKALLPLALVLWSCSALAAPKYLYFVTGNSAGDWEVRNLGISNPDYADILSLKKVLDCTWRINQAEYHFGLGQAACEGFVTADLSATAGAGAIVSTNTAFSEHEKLHLSLEASDAQSLVVESATLYKLEARPMLPPAAQVVTVGLNRLPSGPDLNTPPPAEGELRCDIYPAQPQQCW